MFAIRGTDARGAERDAHQHLSNFLGHADSAGERWAGGVVFYLGATQAPFGEGLWASPLQTLWRNS